MSQVFIETCVLVGVDSAEKCLGSFRYDLGFLDALSKQKTESLIFIKQMLKDLENSANIMYLSKTLNLSPYFLLLLKQDSDKKTGFCLVCDSYQQNLDFHFTVFHKVSKEITEDYRKQFSSHAEAYFPFRPNFKKNKMKVPVYCTGQLKKIPDKPVAQRSKLFKFNEKFLNQMKKSVTELKLSHCFNKNSENDLRIEEDLRRSELGRVNEIGKSQMDCDDENKAIKKMKMSNSTEGKSGANKADINNIEGVHDSFSNDFSVLTVNTTQEAQRSNVKGDDDSDLLSSNAEPKTKSKPKSISNDGQSISKPSLSKTRAPKTIRTTFNKPPNPTPVKIESIEHTNNVNKPDDIVEVQDVLELSSISKKSPIPTKVECSIPSSGLEVFICEICKMAVNISRRQSHMYLHKRNESVSCPTCYKQVRYRNLKNHTEKFHKPIPDPFPNFNESP